MSPRTPILAICLSLSCAASSDDAAGETAATTMESPMTDGGVAPTGYGPCDGEPNQPCPDAKVCMQSGAGEYCAAPCDAGCGDIPGAACVAQTGPGAPTHCGIECVPGEDECPTGMVCVDLDDAAGVHADGLCMWT